MYVGSLSTCIYEHIKFASIKEVTEDVQDDYIYPSDFEKEIDYIVQIEDIVGGSFENHGETYFNISDYDSEFKGHEEIHQGLHESDIDNANFLYADIGNLKYEFFLSIFS